MRSFYSSLVLVLGFVSSEAQAADAETGKHLSCHEARKLADPNDSQWLRCEKTGNGRVELITGIPYRHYSRYASTIGDQCRTVIQISFPKESIYDQLGFSWLPPGMHVSSQVSVTQRPLPHAFGPGESPIWTYSSVTLTVPLDRSSTRMFVAEDGSLSSVTGGDDTVKICGDELDFSQPFTVSFLFDLEARKGTKKSGKPAYASYRRLSTHVFSKELSAGMEMRHVEAAMGTMALGGGKHLTSLSYYADGEYPLDFTLTVTTR